MHKKNYLIVGTIIFFFTALIILLTLNKKESTWIEDVQKASSYEINITNCVGSQTKINNNVINNIEKYWSKLSNNGPWTGDNTICYPTISINYDNKDSKILIIDDDSLVFNNVYYVNARELITYLNSQKQ